MATPKGQRGFQDVLDAAKAAGSKFPELVAAQWALETGWGAHSVGSNLFGIKAKAGEPTVNALTWEVVGGKNIKVVQPFKAYDNWQDSVKDRVDRLENSRYWGADFQRASNAQQAINAMQAPGRPNYATDPNYASKIVGIIKGQGIDPTRSSGNAVWVPPSAKEIADAAAKGAPMAPYIVPDKKTGQQVQAANPGLTTTTESEVAAANAGGSAAERFFGVRYSNLQGGAAAVVGGLGAVVLGALGVVLMGMSWGKE